MQTFTRVWRRADGDAPRLALGVEINADEIRLIQLRCPALDDLGDGDGDAAGLGNGIQVDQLTRHALPAGVVIGSDIVDSVTLTAALGECLARHARRLPASLTFPLSEGALALGLCPRAVAHSRVSLADLMPGFRMHLPGRALDEAAFDALEPWVRLYAQKMTGLDPTDLVVDWYRPFDQDDDTIIVAATQRHYLDVRQMVVEGAGARLLALGDSAAAALGACRFLVARSVHAAIGAETGALYPAPVRGARFVPDMPDIPTSMDMPADGSGGMNGPLHAGYPGHRDPEALYPLELGRRVEEARRAYISHAQATLSGNAHDDLPLFAALWIGEQTWRAWAFDAKGTVLFDLGLPQEGDTYAMLSAMREAKPAALALIVVAGRSAALDPVGGLTALSRFMACPAIEFDAAPCCTEPGAALLSGSSAPSLTSLSSPLSTLSEWGAASAVAFGLALRELMR